MVKITEDVELIENSKKLKKEKKQKKEKKNGTSDCKVKTDKKIKKTDKKIKKEKGKENGTLECELKTDEQKKQKKRTLENGDETTAVKKLKTEQVINGNVDDTLSNSDDLKVFQHGVDADSQEAKGALNKFRISTETIKKLNDRGVKYLFPIQESTYDFIYDGVDVRAQARTGTGKTLAFSLPVVERLKDLNDTKRGRPPKVLVLLPTRELAKQVGDDFISLNNKLSVLCVYGGTPYGPQERDIKAGLDVVVGTPGRVLDFVEKGSLVLSQLKYAILDEVDRMLDMGFKDIVDGILKFAYREGEEASNPQTLLFSATMPAWVYAIAKKYMKENTQFINLVGKDRVKTATTVQHCAIKCSYWDRAATIGDILSVYSGIHGRAMVFCERKVDADELSMSPCIKQETHVLHGDIPQDKREKVLKGFREGKYKVLITTDVAARGLDIPEVDLVIQSAPPNDVDSYIHRSGRTGRAGRLGTCICFYKPRCEQDLQYVERIAGITFKHIGAPTAQDLIESAANDVIRSIAEVPEATLSLFEKSAKQLIEDKGAVRALSAALAIVSGNTEIKERSLLTSSEGCTTYLFRTTVEMNFKGYCFNSLRRKLPEEVMDKIRGCRLCADKKGAVFDLPLEFCAAVEDHWSDGSFDTLTKATELPELEPEYQNNNGGGGDRRSSYGGRGGRGGFRGRGGGRGGRGGGFKSRGSFSSGPAQNTRKTFD